MTETRPAIPDGVARQLRQEAGFGCCQCGHPFIMYHHIVPWAEEHHFRTEDMMILCGQCHPLCTTGALTISDQRKIKLRPKNIVDNELRGKLWVNSRELKVKVGGGFAIETPNILVIADTTVLGARLNKEDGRLLLSAKIQGEDGKLLAQLADNEWSMTPGHVWDFEAYPRNATIRQGLGDIAFAVDSRNDDVAVQGKWFHDGRRLNFTPSKLILDSIQIHCFTASHSNTMVRVD